MYLSRKDFETYGSADGCAGCRDIASGKQRKGSFLVPHAVACRRRMEEAIKKGWRLPLPLGKRKEMHFTPI